MAQCADRHSVPSAISIRNARGEDATAVADLLTLLGYPSTPAQIELRLAQAGASGLTAVFVAESAQRIVGFLSFYRLPLFHADGFLGRITSMVVAADWRGRGVGRQLTAAAEEFAWANGCQRIEVTSGDHRADAHAFYERVGYRLDCRRFLKHRPA